ncbi:MAG TPA: hypothetical protein VFB66_09845 [Tepidisphaeraceae bacterium]|nr:hypothetical protein [Tepidisphaeraceae bacterium]
MLRDEPAWTYVAPRYLTQGYGHVLLMPEYVLGQWVCLRCTTGRFLWAHEFDRPNAIRGVSDGVVIATESRPVGLMGSSDFDCYALDLATGNLLWTTHPSGKCGRGSSEPYWYPDRYDERGAAAAPRRVEDGMCYCKDGRVLDAASGTERAGRPALDVEHWSSRWPAELAHVLYTSRWSKGGLRIAPGRRLSKRHRGNGELTFRMTDDDGREVWVFDLRRHGYEVPHPNFHAYRLAGRYVYIVAAEPLPSEPPAAAVDDEPSSPRSFHLLTLDVEHGTLRQDIRLGDGLVLRRIEDVDEHGLLLSSGRTERVNTSSGNVLRYFERCLSDVLE